METGPNKRESCHLIDAPRLPIKDSHYLEPEEVECLLAAPILRPLEGKRDATMLELLYRHRLEFPSW